MKSGLDSLAYAAAIALALSAFAITSTGRIGAQQPDAATVPIDGDDIGGVVTSTNGPEAGVWVIAETKDLPTTFRRTVVTDDRGRFVVPDLPKAGYNVWARGYGLVDSPPVATTPGNTLALKAVVAPNARAAAQYYPPNYWWSLLEVPPAGDFPGTGGNGNGIPERIRSQSQWIGQFKNGCMSCHQMGDRATREIRENVEGASSYDAWDRRVRAGQMGGMMDSFIGGIGRRRTLQALSDWTDRIAAGEVPPPPPRPQNLERNVVISMWDWSDQYAFVHDTVSTDKRNPTVNADGLVYSVGRFRAPDVIWVDPVRHTTGAIEAPIRDADTPFTNPQTMAVPSPYWGEEIIWTGKASLHNPMMDQKGRLWLSHNFRNPAVNPDFCKVGSSHPSARQLPLNGITRERRQLSVYDPATKQFKLIDTCFGNHHLHFAEDANHTLWTSGGDGVAGWVNTRLFDETGDAVKAQGWTAFILDTNGNGRRDEYVAPNDPIDPKKDKRVLADPYGVIPSPVDGSIWYAVNNTFPGPIVRLNPGANPPETALAEIYEPPFENPRSQVTGYIPRGLDIDRNGVVWTGLAGSGHLASFDRRRCKVLNGPTATGQHCPEGWTLYRAPGPKFKGSADDISTEMIYYNWVDQFDVLGLGRNVPIATGTGSESLLALLPGTRQWVTLHVPYPMGFYHRGLDGRIDDASAGWKGRGLWANYGQYTPWHYEGGKGTTSKAVKFQMRPNPLAK
jgi:hypothetical protein